MSPPIKTLSGNSRSAIADPSAKNSGFDKTVNFLSLFIDCDSSRIDLIVCAVLTGKVLFSTTIVSPCAYSAISLEDASTHLRSLALPAPNPLVLVGVFTEMKIISASEIYFLKLSEKCKFLPLLLEIILSSPLSKIGSFVNSSLFQASTLCLFLSTTNIFKFGHLSAKTAIVGPPTYPAPIQQIFLTLLIIL